MNRRLFVLVLIGILSFSLALLTLSIASSSQAVSSPQELTPSGLSAGSADPATPSSFVVSSSPQGDVEVYQPRSPTSANAERARLEAMSVGVSGWQAYRPSWSPVVEGNLPEGVISQAATQPDMAYIPPGITVDIGRERIYGWASPGATVTITRQSDGAYGAATADGAGFFWTDVFIAGGGGYPLPIEGGDSFDVWIDGAMQTINAPGEIGGYVDVLANEVIGQIPGDSGDTVVTVTLGYRGEQNSAYGVFTDTTQPDGSFSVSVGWDIGAENFAVVDFHSNGVYFRTYLIPDPYVFLLSEHHILAGYAPRGMIITATMYITETGGPIRWHGTTEAQPVPQPEACTEMR